VSPIRRYDNLDRAAFERRYRELLGGLHGPAENTGCVECVGCRGCQDSTFCRDSENLSRCHYCVRCALCTDSSHCRGSRALVACTHAVDSESSVRSSYIVRSISVTDCTYLFGCVGISRKDFHILNEPYERAAYFDTSRRLMRELGLAGAT
jgi:hypothetical protein